MRRCHFEVDHVHANNSTSKQVENSSRWRKVDRSYVDECMDVVTREKGEETFGL